MTAFLLYIARAGLYLAVFYAFYLLVMRRTTFFRLNRVLLLAGSYLCLLLPLIRIGTVSSPIAAGELTMVAGEMSPSPNAISASHFPWKEIVLGLYLFGVAVTLLFYGISAWKMRRVFKKGEAVERDGCRLILLEESAPSFNWGRKVVMSRQDLQQTPAVFTHERMHILCRHSLDLMLFLPVQLLLWWNPLVWITREELRLVHEYEADERVIQKGIDATQYQLLLVRKAVGEQRFSLASGFQHAKLKNRIAMMLKPTTAGWMRWSYLALIPVLATFMFACNPKKSTKVPPPAAESEVPEALESLVTKAVPDSVQKKDAVPFAEVNVKPTFNGEAANEFSKWVNSQLKYPEQAVKDKVQGRVTMRFTIDVDGSVRDVKVLRGIRKDLDDAAVKVVSASPKWEPGKDQEGNKVPVTFVFPVIFQLR